MSATQLPPPPDCVTVAENALRFVRDPNAALLAVETESGDPVVFSLKTKSRITSLADAEE